MAKKKGKLGYKKYEEFPEGKTCGFCGTSVNDIGLLGEIYGISDQTLHYFCLLSASEIEQNGDDSEALLGFYAKDIKKEIARGSKVKCIYCKKPGATVCCVNESCKVAFHLPCGLENGSLHQYFQYFKSFCKKHKPIQEIPANLKKKKTECPMCFSLVKVSKEPHIWPPCCKPDVLMHKNCCQKFALNAGYAMKCPLCNNKKDFLEGLKVLGIFIPDQEATWEVEELNATRRRDPSIIECIASKYDSTCLCPRGVTFSYKRSPKWYIEVCEYCGGGRHRGCMPTPFRKGQPYLCELCSKVDQNAQETSNSAASFVNTRLQSRREEVSSNSTTHNEPETEHVRSERKSNSGKRKRSLRNSGSASPSKASSTKPGPLTPPSPVKSPTVSRQLSSSSSSSENKQSTNARCDQSAELSTDPIDLRNLPSTSDISSGSNSRGADTSLSSPHNKDLLEHQTPVNMDGTKDQETDLYFQTQGHTCCLNEAFRNAFHHFVHPPYPKLTIVLDSDSEEEDYIVMEEHHHLISSPVNQSKKKTDISKPHKCTSAKKQSNKSDLIPSRTDAVSTSTPSKDHVSDDNSANGQLDLIIDTVFSARDMPPEVLFPPENQTEGPVAKSASVQDDVITLSSDSETEDFQPNAGVREKESTRKRRKMTVSTQPCAKRQNISDNNASSSNTNHDISLEVVNVDSSNTFNDDPTSSSSSKRIKYSANDPIGCLLDKLTSSGTVSVSVLQQSPVKNGPTVEGSSLPNPSQTFPRPIREPLHNKSNVPPSSLSSKDPDTPKSFTSVAPDSLLKGGMSQQGECTRAPEMCSVEVQTSFISNNSLVF